MYFIWYCLFNHSITLWSIGWMSEIAFRCRKIAFMPPFTKSCSDECDGSLSNSSRAAQTRSFFCNIFYRSDKLVWKPRVKKVAVHPSRFLIAVINWQGRCGFMFLSALGFLDLPITNRWGLCVPSALLQGVTDILSFTSFVFVKHSLEAVSVLLGKIFKLSPVS